jgi:hypothetical protein
VRALAVLAVLLITGAPTAWALHRKRSDWVSFAFEAFALGLALQLVIAFVAIRTGHFTMTGLVLFTLVIIGAGTGAGIRTGFRQWPRFEWRWVAGVVVVGGLALVLRRHPSYFIFETGDMGEYVNLANIVARGSNLVESFPHGFTLFLAGTNLLLGRAHTVDGLPALGIILLLGVLALGRRLALRVEAVVLVGLVVAVHPVPVWFATFPVSEALYAPLLIISVYFLARARLERSTPDAVVGGIVVGILLLVRGNAILMAPIVVAVFVVSALADDDDRYRIQRAFTVSALGALAVAYEYDVRYLRKYFVVKQLGALAPHRLYSAADRLRLLELSVPSVAALAMLLAAVVAAGYLVRRFVADRVAARRGLVWRVSYLAVIGVTLIVLAKMNTAGLRDALGRWGLALVAIIAGGIVLICVRPTRYLDGALGLFVLLGVGGYAVLFAHRIPAPYDVPYYLYLDRYLFSEVLPLALVLAAIALHALIDGVSQVDVRSRVARIAVIVVVVAVALGPATAETLKITRYTLFGNSYGSLQGIDRLARSRGTKPIVYSGASAMPSNWPGVNTYRAFAVPLAETFGRRVVGLTTFGARRGDPLYNPESARRALKRAGYDDGYLVSLRAPGNPPFPSDADTTYLGTIAYTVPIIGRSVDRSKEKFRDVALQFDVYALS